MWTDNQFLYTMSNKCMQRRRRKKKGRKGGGSAFSFLYIMYRCACVWTIKGNDNLHLLPFLLNEWEKKYELCNRDVGNHENDCQGFIFNQKLFICTTRKKKELRIY